MAVNETGLSWAEALWLFGPERTSVVRSLDKNRAGKYLGEPGINTELLTERFFPVEKSLQESEGFLVHPPVQQATINTITRLQYDSLPLTVCLVNDPWIMASFMQLTT